jgi:hypothetical protein
MPNAADPGNVRSAAAAGRLAGDCSGDPEAGGQASLGVTTREPVGRPDRTLAGNPAAVHGDDREYGQGKTSRRGIQGWTES